MINPVAIAIPFFLLLIGVEVVVARAQGRKVYRINDAISDLGCGIVDQVGEVFQKLFTVLIYAWLWEHARLLDLSSTSAVTWVLALFGVDLGYYLWHRASHRVNFIWAAHVVHHQSPDYNLAVALRQAVLAGTTSFAFYLPLALLGVPVVPFLVARSINLLYQFWIHTETIRTLGPFELVFNTPSHHRAHHGVNPRYIDKNYAGILIIWDKIFGTFEPETEPVIYGTVTPFASWDPIWANFDYWAKLAAMCRKTPRLADKLYVWIAPPEWLPPGVAPFPAPALDKRTKYDVDAPAWHAWIVVQWIPLAGATMGMLLAADIASYLWLVPVAAWVWFTLLVLSARFESKSWFWPAEIARELALGLGGAVAITTLGYPFLAPIPAVVAAGSLLWAARLERAPTPTPEAA
jgi:alkylglycerol monooxygenase